MSKTASRYEVFSAHTNLGVYTAESKEDAIAACIRDAGYDVSTSEALGREDVEGQLFAYEIGVDGCWTFEAAVNLMDDTLREIVHAELSPCTDEDFLARYQELHLSRFGTEFVVN